MADSLKKLLDERRKVDSLYLEQLRELASNETDPEPARRYARQMIDLAAKDSVLHILRAGYLQLGNAERLLGNLEEAMTAYFTSLAFAERIGNKPAVGALYSSIADLYSGTQSHDNAILYYKRSIAILREDTDSVSLGSVLFNLGDEYLRIERPDTALQYLEESGEIFRRIDYPLGVAYNQGNMGVAYLGLKRYEAAEQNLVEAIELLEAFEDGYAISAYLIPLAEVYLARGQIKNAISRAERSLDLAREYGLKQEISEASRLLADLYEQQGNTDRALGHYKEYISYRDSINNLETIQRMADLRTEYEVSQKQVEVDLLNQQKRTQRIIVIATVIALVLIGLLAAGLYRRNQFIRETNQVIEREKERSENLLKNILPEETARELKEHGKVQAKSFPSVTVLFTDFKGFTGYAERLSPEALVQSVDHYFSKFDEIMEQYGLEKIKTIGDAYMCAGGLPDPTDDHAVRMVEAALTISRFVEESKKEETSDQVRFDVRIGISTGPVVAGVIGAKKFAYDIWGDTVNIAARMESSSEPGKINVSEPTYELIKDHFDCEYRGEVAVKNRGAMKMYFVRGEKNG